MKVQNPSIDRKKQPPRNHEFKKFFTSQAQAAVTLTLSTCLLRSCVRGWHRDRTRWLLPLIQTLQSLGWLESEMVTPGQRRSPPAVSLSIVHQI
jgi:hypothetical protein